jgi:hypothetical protein
MLSLVSLYAMLLTVLQDQKIISMMVDVLIIGSGKSSVIHCYCLIFFFFLGF